MEILQKARIAGAVMLATAGVAVGTAQADSLLAPLVIDGSGYETYFNFKMLGANAAAPGAGTDNIHYTWIRKGPTLASLSYSNRATGCEMFDINGTGSLNDMIFQQVDQVGNIATPAGSHSDLSSPAGHAYPVDSFVGMAVISDMSNVAPNVGSIPAQPEGQMSGFAYIVNTATGDIQDYKLINNHRSAADGDFSAAFTSKKSVDLAWMGSAAGNVLFPGDLAQTGWTIMVTGPDMSQDRGLYSSTYDASVTLGQDPRTENLLAAVPAQDAPLAGLKGVYDNDERFYSGEVTGNVTCMSTFTRADLMSAAQTYSTRNGGWTRLSISTVDGVSGVTKHRSSGALVYRADRFNMGLNGLKITMQPETSGHMTTGRNHPNRPF